MKLPRLTPIAFACATVLASSSLYAAANEQSHNAGNSPQVNNKQVSINLASSDLALCINTFAKQADIFISADAKFTNNKRCQALNFTGSLSQALAKLLMGTDLTLKQIAVNKYVLSANEESTHIGTLATAIVQSEDLKDGSAADGYRTDEISAVGPWQGRTLQETPYSINVVSESLIKNIQATSPDQVYKMNPLIQLTLPQSANNNAIPAMRGFESISVASNGISREKWNFSHDLVMEDTAQIEVLTGLTGFFLWCKQYRRHHKLCQ